MSHHSFLPFRHADVGHEVAHLLYKEDLFGGMKGELLRLSEESSHATEKRCRKPRSQEPTIYFFIPGRAAATATSS